jgi:hypothetical protein
MGRGSAKAHLLGFVDLFQRSPGPRDRRLTLRIGKILVDSQGKGLHSMHGFKGMLYQSVIPEQVLIVHPAKSNSRS